MPNGLQTPRNNGFSRNKRKLCPEVQVPNTKGKKGGREARKVERNEEREWGGKWGGDVNTQGRART